MPSFSANRNWDSYISFSFQEGRAVPPGPIPEAEGLINPMSTGVSHIPPDKLPEPEGTEAGK